jgi:hypothetical protein
LPRHQITQALGVFWPGKPKRVLSAALRINAFDFAA